MVFVSDVNFRRNREYSLHADKVKWNVLKGLLVFVRKKITYLNHLSLINGKRMNKKYAMAHAVSKSG